MIFLRRSLQLAFPLFVKPSFVFRSYYHPLVISHRKYFRSPSKFPHFGLSPGSPPLSMSSGATCLLPFRSVWSLLRLYKPFFSAIADITRISWSPCMSLSSTELLTSYFFNLIAGFSSHNETLFFLKNASHLCFFLRPSLCGLLYMFICSKFICIFNLFTSLYFSFQLFLNFVLVIISAMQPKIFSNEFTHDFL